jgi:hypothetical protein
MRPFEIFFVSALALILVTAFIPRSKRPGWLRFLPALPLFLLLLQVFVEGPRWQMVPAYVLSVVVCLVGLPTMIRRQPSKGEQARIHRVLAIIGSIFGLAVVWITLELCVQVPVFRMPVPSGPYSVGTRTFVLVDESRIDDQSPLDNGYRSMSIQAWYPAKLTGNEERTTYIRSDIRNEMAALEGPPAYYIGHMDQIQTYAHWNAPIAHAAKRFPVILYSPSGNASLHKILFEELASQGYVVVSISHPHWNNVLFDDQGEIIPQGGVSERFQVWFQEADKPAVRSAQGLINSGDDIGLVEQAQIELNDARPIAIAELRQWAEDEDFVLDQLSEMSQTEGFFEGHIDLSRIGAMGFSLGGATAGQFCVTNARCQAGINVDGFMFGDILDNNLKVPFMFMHSSYPGVQPVGGLFYEWAENSAYMLQIGGSSHPDLGAPAPTGEPILIQVGMRIGQFPDGVYLAQIMNDYILAFFDKHLRNMPAPLLDGPSPYPEVLFVKKDVH